MFFLQTIINILEKTLIHFLLNDKIVKITSIVNKFNITTYFFNFGNFFNKNLYLKIKIIL
jgi:hypothetical protein